MELIYENEKFEKTTPRRIRSYQLELIRDLVDNGQLVIKVKCGQPAQYFGMAQPDLFLHAADRPFYLNFMKGHISVWLQMLMVTCVKVMVCGVSVKKME